MSDRMLYILLILYNYYFSFLNIKSWSTVVNLQEMYMKNEDQNPNSWACTNNSHINNDSYLNEYCFRTKIVRACSRIGIQKKVKAGEEPPWRRGRVEESWMDGEDINRHFLAPTGTFHWPNGTEKCHILNNRTVKFSIRIKIGTF